MLRWFTCTQTVTHPSTSPAVHGRESYCDVWCDLCVMVWYVCTQHRFDASQDIRALTLNKPLAPYKSPNHESIGQLFVSFLHYYAHDFKYVWWCGMYAHCTALLCSRLQVCVMVWYVRTQHSAALLRSRLQVCVTDGVLCTHTAQRYYAQNFSQLFHIHLLEIKYTVVLFT